MFRTDTCAPEMTDMIASDKRSLCRHSIRIDKLSAHTSVASHLFARHRVFAHDDFFLFLFA